ncbi:Uncharacterized protein SCF082_LOCUS51906 [Durusdinium trenchii]|uniref:Uncharacterized protein n=1 Tax=Durusdinium trenchii TaxID=1381693 RepID=A0ABP0SI10_9DINO
MWDHTKPRQGFDLDKEPVLQDITLALGFISSLGLVLRTQRKGLSWLAVPCQSFSFMSSSCHRRSWADPYGSLNRQFVQMGNCICARSCILILVSLARSVVFFVENPLQSSLQCWPFLNYLMHMPVLGSHRTSWLMGYYGGWSLKPQLGLSNAIWAGYLDQAVSKENRKALKDKAKLHGKEIVKLTVSKSSNKIHVTLCGNYI